MVHELYLCFTEAVSLPNSFVPCFFPLSFRYKAKGDRHASPATEEDSQSKRQIKKPVYRLNKTQAAEANSRSKEDGRTKSKRFQDSRGNCLNKEERTVSERPSLHESKHVEKRSSKHFNSFKEVKEKSEGGPSERPSYGSSLSSKCPGSTATLVFGEQKDRSACKRKFAAEKTDRDHKEFKTRESCKTSSSSKHLLKQKEKELVERLCPRLENTEFKAKRKFYKDEVPASVKDATSGSSSNASNSNRTNSKNAKSVSDRTSDSLPCPSTSSLPPNYKIPKMVQSNLTACHKDSGSEHSKPRNEPSNFRASVSSSVTLKEAHRCPGAAPGHVSDRRERKSSLSEQLLSASHSATELWCDEVSENTLCFFRKLVCFSFVLAGCCDFDKKKQQNKAL